MSPDARRDRDDRPDDETGESTTDQSASTSDRSGSTADTDESSLDVTLAADRLGTVLDGAGALVDECRLRFDDGLVLRARDPADVAMAELSLSVEAFEEYAAAERTFGVALDRFGDAVSVADGDVRLTLDDRGRFRVEASPVEYALAPIDPQAVRAVEWIDGTAAASVELDGRDLRRAVRAADLVADHATFDVDADAETFAVSASGDTDDVTLDFTDELGAFEPGSVESMYAVDYLQRIVRTVPPDATVTLAFLEAAEPAGRPLALRHEVVDGTGSARWLLAPRIQR
jgi:proliferating cell nuclear antigen